MSKFFKATALFIAVACLVWVGVLWHWQTTQRDMSEQDIGVYLVALPITLFVLLLLARWAWQGAARAAADKAASAAAPAAPANSQPPTVDEAERRACVQLLSAQLNCAAGSDTAALWSALEAGEPRPALDPELLDEQGLPLMTARIADLDPDALDLSDSLAGTRAQNKAWQHLSPRPEALRALAALQPVLQASLAALAPWQSLFAPQPQAGLPATSTPPAMLRVVAWWPTAFTPFEAALAQAWLQRCTTEAAGVPATQLAWVQASPGAQWQEVERLVHAVARDGRLDAVLLVACHSAIGSNSVESLLASGRIFTSRHPQQPMAGEAAAALLLAPDHWPAAEEQAAPAVHLHRAALGRRDKPVDAEGRSSSQVAQACVAQAIQTSGVAAEAVAAAVHDADQHTARAAEALTTLLQQLPHLQPSDDVRQSGALTAQTGVVAPLITIALAAHQATLLNQPCLALSVDDAQQRLALLARPAPLVAQAAA